jgi:hypothetical protein
MQDFPDRTDLGNGTSWSASFKGHDWAHYGSFFFIITIFQEDVVIKRFPVEMADYKYGDPTCTYSRDEILQKVRLDLHRLAMIGETDGQKI